MSASCHGLSLPWHGFVLPCHGCRRPGREDSFTIPNAVGVDTLHATSPPPTAFLSPLPLFIILIIAIATSILVKNNPIIIVFSTLLFIVRPDVVKCLIIVCQPNIPRRLVCLLFWYDFFTVIRSKNKAMIRRYKK